MNYREEHEKHLLSSLEQLMAQADVTGSPAFFGGFVVKKAFGAYGSLSWKGNQLVLQEEANK